MWLKISLITAIAAILYGYSAVWKSDIITQDHVDKEYDFIIVGGGSAGNPVAARLSENPRVKVLLLEAGTADPPHKASIPNKVAGLQFTELDWKYRVTGKDCCRGLNDKVGNWPRGKVLGGSSILNYMVYIRGSRHDYDAWRDAGCTGWGYEDVLPYFKKAEGNQNPHLANSEYHGSEGPLKVSDINVTVELTNAYLAAAEELGHPTLDVNGESMFGFMHNQATVYRGARCSTKEAYIRPAMHRKNLHILADAHVTKVLIKEKRAVGVEFVRKGGSTEQVFAKKEVILSAGAIGSPHILLLSGVGPKAELDKHKIKVEADLPVGENLQDHFWSDSGLFMAEKPLTMNDEKVLSWKSFLDFYLKGQGPLTASGVQGNGFIKSNLQPKDALYPYLQIKLIGGSWSYSQEMSDTMMKDFNVRKDVWEALHGDLIVKEAFSVMPILLHPWSRGTISLHSRDPQDHPLINPRLLEDPRDIKVLVEGMNFVQRMESTKAFRAIGARLSRRMHPLCTNHEWGSDDYWGCYIRENYLTLYHPSGTCKMGAQSDPTAVVDPKLRVKGIQGLRVADASIMPFVISGNTNAPSIMIGEKAADIIKQDHHLLYD